MAESCKRKVAPGFLDEHAFYTCGWCGQVSPCRRDKHSRFFIGARIGPSREYQREVHEAQIREWERMKFNFKDVPATPPPPKRLKHFEGSSASASPSPEAPDKSTKNKSEDRLNDDQSTEEAIDLDE